MTIALVQASAVNDTIGTTDTITLPAVGAGHCLVLTMRLGGTVVSGDWLTGVSDNLNGSWTILIRQVDSNSGNLVYFAYMPNAAAGSTTVTITASNASHVTWGVMEYSGVATASPVDVSNSKNDATGTSTAVDSSSVTTTNANDLLIAAYMLNDTAAETWTLNVAGSNPSSGWTNRLKGYGSENIFWTDDNIVSATGTYVEHATISPAASYAACLVALKAAAAGTTFNKALTIACSSTLHITKRASKKLSIAGHSSVARIKSVGSTKKIASSSSVAAQKSTSKSLLIASASAVAATARMAFTLAVSIACGSALSTSKLVGKRIGIASSSVLSPIKAITRALSISASSSVSTSKSVAKLFAWACASSLSAVATKAHLVLITIASSTAISNAMSVSKGVAISCNSAVSSVKGVAKATFLIASASVVSGPRLAINLAASIAVSSAVSVARSISKLLSIAAGCVVAVVFDGQRLLFVTVSIAASSSVALSNTIGKQFAISVASALDVAKAIKRTFVIAARSSVFAQLGSASITSSIVSHARYIVGRAFRAVITGTASVSIPAKSVDPVTIVGTSMTTVHDPIDFVCGTNWEFTGPLQDASGNPLNLAGAVVQWKLDSLDGLQNIIVCDNGSNAGVTVLDAAAGTILVNVPPSKTSQVAAGSYRDWLRVTMPDGSILPEWTGVIRVAAAPA